MPAVKRMMARTGEVLFEKLLILQTADNMAKNLEHFPEKKNRIDASMQIYKQILAERQPYLVSHLAVNGKDLIRLGYRPGREIGDVLRKLIDEVIIDAKLNNRDYLLKEARILKKSNSKKRLTKVSRSACRQKCLHAGRGREISSDFVKMNSSAYGCTLEFI